MTKHILQSQAWNDFQRNIGRKTFYKEAKDYSYLAILEQTKLGNYLFVPYGPAADTKKGQKAGILALKELATREKAIFVRIEPLLPLSETDQKDLNLQKTKDIEPKYTRIIDLTRPEEEILADIEKRKVRYWRNYAKKGISIEISKNPTDFDALYDFYTAISKTNNFATHDKKYLKAQFEQNFTKLYVARYENQPIAAYLIYDDENTRYFTHGGADYEHRNLAAGTILVIQMILDAKKSGQKSFDMWGVCGTDDKNDPWYGFTSFKNTFGGQQVEFAGTYDLPIDTKKYRIYKNLRKINRIKRKILKK